MRCKALHILPETQNILRSVSKNIDLTLSRGNDIIIA